MKFLDPLIVRHLDSTTWVVEQDLRFISNSGDIIYIPAGLETDFASVPRVFWSIIPPTGRWGSAAVLHDFLYETRFYDRKTCDDLFLEAMKNLGVNYFVRYIMYYAVRSFGKKIYET